uniref:Uncharacterized protein n=1 Tax=Lotharella globosa TaxID=91324 RepID=A0A7S3Z148_9EUKA
MPRFFEKTTNVRIRQPGDEENMLIDQKSKLIDKLIDQKSKLIDQKSKLIDRLGHIEQMLSTGQLSREEYDQKTRRVEAQLGTVKARKRTVEARMETVEAQIAETQKIVQAKEAELKEFTKKSEAAPQGNEFCLHLRKIR